MVRALAVLALASFVTACSLDRTTLGGRTLDAGRSRIDATIELDAGELDAGEPVDADTSLDAFVPADAPTVDAYTPPVEDLCPSDPSLVACYRFDGDVNDHGARANHLAAANVSYDSNGGVLLSAASSLVRAPRAELMHVLTSVDAWVRLDAPPPASTRAMIADHDGVFGLWVQDGELVCAMTTTGSGATFVRVAGALPVGEIHHVACVLDGATSALFVDAVLVGSTAALGQSVMPATPLQIGENATPGNDQWIGLIDDLRLWDRGRTLAELQADVARGRH